MKYIGGTIKSGVIALLAITATMSVNSYALASTECHTQYGGGEVCEDKDAKLKVDKKIYNPKSGDWENNISRKDGSYPYVFEDEETIKFKIVVENTGEVEIRDIRLTDVMPSIIEYKSGDGDEDGDKVKFDKFDLEPGEEKSFEFKAKVEWNGIKPKDDDYICVSNVAKAKGERKDNGDDESNADYANFCVEVNGKVLGKESPKKLPTTGPIDSNAIMVGLSGLGLAFVGYGLKRLSK